MRLEAAAALAAAAFFQDKEDTGVCGGVRKFSLGSSDAAAAAAAALDVDAAAAEEAAASRMLRLARACWCSWDLFEAAAWTSDGGRPMFWYCAAS